MNEEAGRFTIPATGFDDLLCSPLGCWMAGYLDMHDHTTGVVDHEEDIESSKIDRLDTKEVASPDISGMSPEKNPPSGGRYAVIRSSHILRHGSGRDLVAQPIQLRLDPLLTPQTVLRSHAPNKISQLSRDLVPPSPVFGM